MPICFPCKPKGTDERLLQIVDCRLQIAKSGGIDRGEDCFILADVNLKEVPVIVVSHLTHRSASESFPRR